MRNVFYGKERALEALGELIEKPHIEVMVNIRAPKKKVLLQDFPEDIYLLLKDTSIESNLRHGAYYFSVDKLWHKLSVEQIKVFFRVLFDLSDSISVKFDDAEVMYRDVTKKF